MLQTTMNQLTPEHIMLKHRERIIDELINAGYQNVINDRFNRNFNYIIDSNAHSPEHYLDFDLDLDPNNYEQLIFGDNSISCSQFTNNDILAISELYITILKNTISEIPELIASIENFDNETIEPDELANLIANFLD